MAEFLFDEWDIRVHRSTVFRFLKEYRISHEQAQRFSNNQSQILRNAWIAFAADVTAEQLIFLDESLFKAQICWRSMAYAPIGDPVRWQNDIREETLGVGARVAGRRPWGWRAWIERNGVQTLQHYRIHY